MSKDKSDAEKKARKEEKKKRKLDESTVDVEEPAAKKEKKDKKKRKSTADEDVTIADESMMDVTVNDAEEKAVVASGDVPLAALVPFANPLADDKQQKKVLKGVKKAAKNKTLKRGVKECVKAIRKSPVATPATLASSAPPPGIVVLAADISPMDVISHIPVLCEDHNLPYLFVPSRAELGAAGSTKRPTSVVMISAKKGPKAKAGEEGEEDWSETYKELWKLAVKMGQTVKV